MNIKIDPIEYISHPYNQTITNERCIEIVLMQRYIKEKNSDLIEIGCVAPYYLNISHDCFDPYDNHPLSKKEFAEKIDIKGKNILCISTIEHMGNYNGPWGGNEVKDPNVSINFLKKLQDEANSFLVSFPIGAHDKLEDYFKSNAHLYKWFCYQKVSQSPPLWEINNDLSFCGRPYGEPFPHGNFIYFIYKGIDIEY